MIKQTMAALLLTTTVAVADDMMMNRDSLDNQANVTISALEVNDADGGNIEFDGRYGILEGSANHIDIGSEDRTKVSGGLVYSLGGNFGVSAGVVGTAYDITDVDDFTADGYVAGIYDNDKFEARVQIEENSETYDAIVSGRYYISDRVALAASVEGEVEGVGEELYTVGLSFKF